MRLGGGELFGSDRECVVGIGFFMIDEFFFWFFGRITYNFLNFPATNTRVMGNNWGVYPDPFGNYGARFYDAQITRGVVPLVKSMLFIAMHLAEAFFWFYVTGLMGFGTGQALSLPFGL